MLRWVEWFSTVVFQFSQRLYIDGSEWFYVEKLEEKNICRFTNYIFLSISSKLLNGYFCFSEFFFFFCFFKSKFYLTVNWFFLFHFCVCKLILPFRIYYDDVRGIFDKRNKCFRGKVWQIFILNCFFIGDQTDAIYFANIFFFVSIVLFSIYNKVLDNNSVKIIRLRFNFIFLSVWFPFLLFGFLPLSVTTATLSTFLLGKNLFRNGNVLCSVCSFIRHLEEIIEKHWSLFKLVVIRLRRGEKINLISFLCSQKEIFYYTTEM